MRVFGSIMGHPLATLTVLGLITAGAAALAGQVSFESAIEVWFLEDDPALATYDEFTARFAADEMVVLALDTEVFSEEAYSAIDRITQQVARAPHVHRVRSLLDFDLDPAITFNDADLEDAPPDWQARRRHALENHLIMPAFVSEDGRTTAIVVEVARSGNTVDGKRALITALDAMVEAETARSGIPIWMTGTPALDHRALEYNDRDLTEVYPLIVPFIIAFCWLVFGSLWLALIPLLVVTGAAGWAFGLMGLLGLKTTLLSSALFPLFLAVGVADAMHLLAYYQRRLRDGIRGPTAAMDAAVRLWKPCLFTSITTAVGMASLAASPLRPVREFGLIAASGVLAAFVLTMTAVPALLQLIGDRRALTGNVALFSFDVVLKRLVSFLARPNRLFVRSALTAGLLVGLLGIASATRLEIGVDPMSWFREDDPFRRATEHADTALGGAASIEFLVRVKGQGFRNREVLHVLDDFERWLERSTLVNTCVSGVDILKETTRMLSVGEDRVARIPRPPEMIRSLLDTMAERGDLERWITLDFKVGRISCRVPLRRVADFGSQLALIKNEIGRRFATAPITLEPTGYGVLIVQMEHHLVESQVKTIAIAFAVVLLLLAVLIRSAKVAGIAMVPNLLPVVAGMGLMPLLGISLNPGTAMVAAVALGIVVDDTAHLLVAMRRRMDMGDDAGEASADAVREVGTPVILTTVAMVGSMGVLTLGSFAPGVHFGIIAMTIAAIALPADLLLLPRLLGAAYAGRRSGRNGSDVGEGP